MIKSGGSTEAQASIKAAFDFLRIDIQNEEAEILDRLAELERKVNEVRERVKIEPLADQQAANLATDKNFDPQEELQDTVADNNELLSKKVDELNLELKKSRAEA